MLSGSYYVLIHVWYLQFLYTHVYIHRCILSTCTHPSCDIYIWYWLADCDFICLTHTYMYTFTEAHLYMYAYLQIYPFMCLWASIIQHVSVMYQYGISALACIQVVIHMLLVYSTLMLCVAYHTLILVFIYNAHMYSCMHSSRNPIHLRVHKLWYICWLTSISFSCTHVYVYIYMWTPSHENFFVFSFIWL